MGFVTGGHDYYVSGGSSNYSSNKTLLDGIFGNGICQLYNEGQSNEFYDCNNEIDMTLTARPNGNIVARNMGDISCTVNYCDLGMP